MKNPINSILKSVEEKAAAPLKKATKEVPSHLFLWGAGAALLTFLTLKCCKKDHSASFVRKIVSPLLLLGLYRKADRKHVTLPLS